MTKTFVSFTFIATLFVACINEKSITDSNQIVETGDEITKTISLAEFDKIDLSGTDNITIKQGPIQEIVVTGHENIIERLNRKVENNEWKATLSKGNYKKCHLKIFITVPSIQQLKLTGVGDINLEYFDQLNELTLLLDGVGDINCSNLEPINQLNATLNGVGDFNFDNCKTINKLELKQNGVGDFNAFSTETTVANIHLSGTGDCHVKLTNKLDAKLSGVGDINYKGNPQVNQKITGSGKIIKL